MSPRPTAIDLFAGPGGLSLGLKAAGFDIVAAIERDGDAGRTYRHNVGAHTFTRDITAFGPDELRQALGWEENHTVDLVAGGPPCPGFSLIGRSKIMDLIKKGKYGDSKDFRHGFIDDPRNRLFLEFVKFVEAFRPKYFVMENVSGMSSYNLDGDPVIGVIQSSFGQEYNVTHKIVSASDYGVPQDRKRIIFIGSRNDVLQCHIPNPTTTNQLTALDAIHDVWNVEPNNETGVVSARAGRTIGKGGAFRKRMRTWPCEREDGSLQQAAPGVKTCHWTRKVNERDQVIFPFIRSGAPSGELGGISIPPSIPRQIYGDVYPARWESDLAPAFDAAGLRAWEDGRHFVENQEGKRWVMYDQKGFKDKMRRIRWDRAAPTVVAHLAKDGYMFIHPEHHRMITVREAARFQSFPDAFEFKGSMSSQFRQVGNAVPPLLAEALGKHIIMALTSEEGGEAGEQGAR